jgi:hypothetical protein
MANKASNNANSTDSSARCSAGARCKDISQCVLANFSAINMDEIQNCELKKLAIDLRFWQVVPQIGRSKTVIGEGLTCW